MTSIIIDHEYHVIELERLTTELIEWLNESFGPPGERWWINHYRIYFRDSKDHLLCTLRWS
jgi:hypothetical protein